MTKHASKTDVLSRIPSGARVAILRLRSLGDCVLTTPAIALLHQHRPDLVIGVVVDPPFRAIFEGNPAVQTLLAPEVSALRGFEPSMVLNYHGGTRSMLLSAMSGARVRAGFAHHRYSALVYNVAIPRAQQVLGVERKVHTAEHLASAMFHLGVPVREIPRAQLFFESTAVEERYAVVHAVASAPEKTWPAARFVEVAKYLRSELSLQAVFIGTAADDMSAFHGFRTVTPALSETKRLLAGASLFVGNDSGPAHMAAAFGVPVVVLFAASDPVVWAPWKTQAESIVEPGGMERLSVTRVIDAVNRVFCR